MKRVFLFILVVGMHLMAFSQTYYYKLSKVVSDGSTSAGNNSGIFVTFTSKGCYDSDKDGYTMNNGFQEFLSKGVNGSAYTGSSYYGHADYYFSPDYSLLNVKTDRGMTFVYHRTASGGKEKSTYYVMANQGNGGSGGIALITPVLDSGRGNSSGISTTTVSSKRKCIICCGNGRCTHCSGGTCGECLGKGVIPCTYTTDYMTCSYCSGSGRCGRCSGSGQCNACHGRGEM